MPRTAIATLPSEARKKAQPPDETQTLTMPPEEVVILEISFLMGRKTDDNDAVNLRIYEDDHSRLIADLHISRAALGDLLGARSRLASMTMYRR